MRRGRGDVGIGIRPWARTAVLEREPDAGITGVIRSRGLAQLVGAKDLRTVLDDAVHQGALGKSGVGQGLLHAQRAIEVAHRDGGLALVGDVDHAQQHHEHDRSHGPQHALAPARVPGDRQGEQRGDDHGDRQVVIEREQQRAGDADEERAKRAAGGKEQIEERGFRRARGAQGHRFAMAEEAGKKDLNQEDAERHPQRPGDFDVGKRVAQAGENDDQETGRAESAGRGA